MRKKLLAILLALTAAGSLAFGLTACGNSGNNTDNGSNTEQPDVVYSEGLALELSADETFYIVTGVGTCKDTKIYIPKTYNGKPVTGIGSSAFKDCSSLESVTFGENSQLTSIGDYAFLYCISLESITIPDSVTSIGSYAFEYCRSLTSVTIPDSVTYIDNYAFYYCRSLESITFNGTNEQWNAISKCGGWNYDTGNYVIHCTDGDIEK